MKERMKEGINCKIAHPNCSCFLSPTTLYGHKIELLPKDKLWQANYK